MTDYMINQLDMIPRAEADAMVAAAYEAAATAGRAPEQWDGVMDQMTQAARDVLAERRRQIEAEGWTPEHDDAHAKGEMAQAAACYANHAPARYADHRIYVDPRITVPIRWPWARKWWKPADRRRDLVKAAALILAEIERLDRAAGGQAK